VVRAVLVIERLAGAGVKKQTAKIWLTTLLQGKILSTLPVFQIISHEE